MNILIVGTAFPLRGGIAHYNALLAQALARRHTVDTITFKRQYPSLLFPGSSQVETGSDIPADPAPQLIDSINPWNWLSVGRLIRSRAPDLIIMKYWLPFFGPCFGTLARQAKRGTGTRVLYICDNVIPHEHRPGDAALTRYAFRAADCFIVQSDAVEQDLLRFRPDARYRKVPHPVYSLFGTPLDRNEARRILGIQEEKVLLFFGYVRAYKGLGVLLDAFRIVRERHAARLLVVGEFYEGEEKYREQIRSLGIGDAVTIHADYVPNDRVGLWFSAADAAVLPYLSATQSGIVQIAYNFDTPVIATAVGGLTEVVKERTTGLLVPPGNPQALAAAIDTFYQEGNAAAYSNAVREEKKHYTWDALVSAIEDLTQQ